MKVEKNPDGTFSIVQVAQRLTLTLAQYEDIYFALPQDNGTLFRLINDTVCNTDALRQAWRALVTEAGGMEAALTALQPAVQAVSPK